MSEESQRQADEDEALAQRVLHRPDMLRRAPKGPQFNPEAGSPAQSNFWRQILGPTGNLVPEEELYPDFIKTRRQYDLDPMMAQRGVGSVPHLAGGTDDLANFMTVGQGNIPPEDWYSATHHQGFQLPDWAASITPEFARQLGITIDPQGFDPNSWFRDPQGRWNYAGDVSSGGGRQAIEFRWPGGSPGLEGKKGIIETMKQYLASHGSLPGVAPATGRVSGPYRDLSTPTGPLGMGTRYFETPESEFPRATPGPSIIPQQTGGGTTPPADEGQVSAGGSNIGYAPGTYTGTLGGPGDPGGSGGSNNPVNFQNELGYDPSVPYGDFNSGVPTRKGFGTGGSIFGGAVGNLLLPGLGGIVGGAAGGKFGSWLGKLFNNWRMNQGAGGSGSGGGTSTSGGGSGQPGAGGDGGGFDFGKFFGDPGYSDPAYLKSIGYGQGQGTGSLWPGSTGNPGYAQDNPNSALYDPRGPMAGSMAVGGIGENGGSYFHTTPGGRFFPLPGSFAGLGSFGGASPLSGPWGGINSPVGRAALAGQIIDPGRMPSPDYNWGNTQISAPGQANIINPAAFGQASSANQSIHFRPRAND